MSPLRFLLPVLLLPALLSGCHNPYAAVVHEIQGDPAAAGYVYCPGVAVPDGPAVSDCGPEAMTAVLNFYGDTISLEEVTKAIFVPTLNGTLSLDMQLYARRRGFTADFAQGNLDRLKIDLREKRPAIIMVDMHTLPPGIPKIPRLHSLYHFFVVTGYNDAEQCVVAELTKGRHLALQYDYLQKAWAYAGNYVLVLQRRNSPESEGAEAARKAYNAGARAEAAGRLEEASSYYTRALSCDPAYARPLMGLGNVYQARQDFGHAEEAYRKAMAMDPQAWAAMNNLAWMWVTRRERYEEAESLAAEAVRGYARELMTYRLVADAEIGEADGEPAPGTLARLTATQQGYANALSTLAHVQRETGRLHEATRTWELAVHEGISLPLDMQAGFLYELGSAYEREGRPDQARLTLAEAMEFARSEEWRGKIGAAIERLGRTP